MHDNPVSLHSLGLNASNFLVCVLGLQGRFHWGSNQMKRWFTKVKRHSQVCNIRISYYTYFTILKHISHLWPLLLAKENLSSNFPISKNVKDLIKILYIREVIITQETNIKRPSATVSPQFLTEYNRWHPSMVLNKWFPHARELCQQSNLYHILSLISAGEGKKTLPSFLCLNAFPAFPTAMDCVVAGLFIAQRKEKAPLEAGKLSWERIEGSVAAI